MVLALLSVVIVWSESTFGIPIGGENNYLSVCSTLVYHGHSKNNYAIVEVSWRIVLLSVLALGNVLFSTLLQIC